MEPSVKANSSESNETPTKVPPPATKPVILYAAGFNAHGQLLALSKNDLRTFQPIPDSVDLEILYSTWGSTVFYSGNEITGYGAQKFTQTTELAAGLRSSFGDHNGLLGCLNSENQLLTIAQPTTGSTQLLQLTHACDAPDEAPKLSHVAMSGTGRIALTFKQAPNGNLCHIAEFANLEKLVAWYRDPSGEGNYPSKHHMLPGRPKQLVANSASFVLLMEDGSVYTWGDPRHQTLGRGIMGDGAIEAEKPGPLEALAGLTIVKIATGGWMSAALSADGAAYLWGAGTPGSEGKIRCLRDVEIGEVALIDLPHDGEEPLDVVDIAVGNGHAAFVAEGKRLFVVGEDSNGQLGINNKDRFLEEWRPVDHLTGVERVICGPKSTFAFVEQASKKEAKT